MKVIAVCTCSGMKEKAESAFRILFPKDTLPQIVRGKDAIKKVASYHKGQNIGNYLEAIAKKSGKFSYYIEYDDRGDVINNINLMTGKKVA